MMVFAAVNGKFVEEVGRLELCFEMVDKFGMVDR